MLLAMDVEEVDEPGQLKQGLHFLVDMDQLHLSARLPHDAVTPGEFAQTVAVDEIDAGKIDQKLLAAVAGEHVDQVAKLSATVAQCEPADNIDHDDSIQFSGRNLKSHSRFAARFFWRDHMPGGAGFQAQTEPACWATYQQEPVKFIRLLENHIEHRTEKRPPQPTTRTVAALASEYDS